MIDQIMPLEYGVLQQGFQVSPDFAFFDDSSGANALATTANIVGSSPHGSVLFGIRLLQAELGTTWWGAAIAGIAAHEFAHIVQFHSGVGGPVYRRELHADFMAGWYLGAKQIYGTPVMIGGLGQSLFGKGDFDFNSPGHHGTPQQRVSAMLAGYQRGLSGLNMGQAFSFGRSQFQV
jgi:hypothetical protein